MTLKPIIVDGKDGKPVVKWVSEAYERKLIERMKRTKTGMYA